MGLVVASFVATPLLHPSDAPSAFLFQPFLQAPGRARIDPFQLLEDFLQGLLGLRVVVHRVRIAHSPVVVFLAVLRQVLPHIPPLVNLATLHFHLVTENPFHTGAQRFRSINAPARYRRFRSSPRSTRSSNSPFTTAVFSVAPCHTPKTCFSPLSAIPRATTSTWPPK